MCLMNMHIFPSTDELHNYREKFSNIIVPHKTSKTKRESRKRERESKKWN